MSPEIASAFRGTCRQVGGCVRRGALPRKFGGMPTPSIWSEADIRLRFVAELLKGGHVCLEDLHLEATGYGVGPIDLALVGAADSARACDASSRGKFRTGEFPLDGAIEFAVLQELGPRNVYGEEKLREISGKLEILRGYYPAALLATAVLVRAEHPPIAPEPVNGVENWVEWVPFPS